MPESTGKTAVIEFFIQFHNLMLNFQTYVKFCNIGDINIRYDCSPFRSKNGFLPYLVDGNEQFCGYEKIIGHFKKDKGYVLDNDKSEQFISYIRQNLYPFFMYHLFGNPQNSDEARSTYALQTPFPFNFFYPYKYIRKTEEVTQALASFSLEDPIDAHDTVEIESKAKKCLNWISEKLNGNEYFINGSPSESKTCINYFKLYLTHVLLQLMQHYTPILR
jgi:metaxin